MIVDSSALVAVLNNEPEAAAFLRVMIEADCAMSAATYVETALVVDGRQDAVLSRQFDELLERLGVEICAVTVEQARVARQAYRDFGRGSGHPAHLNYGDCFSYALATSRRESLLFKGSDFSQTDVLDARQSPG